MGYKIKVNYARRENYGSLRDTGNIKYLVFHYTGNDGDSDEANANYFHNRIVGASAHAFIDDDSVTYSVPAKYVAWAVGSNGYLDQGSPYAKYGHKYWGKCNNSNSYSIELCDTLKDGKHNISAKTRENAIKYGAKIMKKYNIPIERVIRHFDVNGKLCPIYWVTNEADWNRFKLELLKEVGAVLQESYPGPFPNLPAKGYLSKGDRGRDVVNLQKFLNWMSVGILEEDGIFGSDTEKAVIKFQEINRLEADGYFGQASLKAAKNAVR